MKTWRCLGAAAIASTAVCILTACTTKVAPTDDEVAARITSYNHTPDYIHRFYVDGTWGGNSFAYGGGGKFVCCIAYPRTWHPGLTATVKWTTSSSDPNATGDAVQPHWHEAVVPIERYVEAGTLHVHFLPGGDVRLIVSSKAAGHPDYPGPSYPVKPADFHFEPSRHAVRLQEERVRAQAAGGARLQAEMRALESGASVQKVPSSDQPSEVKLPPPPVLPEDERRAPADNNTLKIRFARASSATVQARGGDVYYELQTTAGIRSATIATQTESAIHLEAGDYDFSGRQGFAFWSIDEGQGVHKLYRVFTFSRKRNDFVERHPHCGDAFLNLRVDAQRKQLISTFFENNVPKSCVTRLRPD